MAAISRIEAIKRLKRGDMIQVTLRDPRKDSDRDRFTFCKSRGGVTKRTFDAIREDLAPQMDGLFPDEASQTYAWGGDL